MTITAQPVLRYLKDRLRQSYVDDALWSDADVLTLLNDAYQDACEASQCLQSFYTVPIVSGTAEYALPDDFDQLVLVVSNGAQLAPVALSESLSTTQSGYYLYGKPGTMTLGLAPTPSDDSADRVLVLYSASPTLLTDFDATFDARFPVEFADMLVHYARWRVQMTSGGAERIQNAGIDRSLYDQRVKQLRRTATTVGSNIMPGHFTHVSDRRSHRAG